MKNQTNKQKPTQVKEYIEHAEAVLVALSLAAENMEPCDIVDVIDVCRAILAQAGQTITELEGGL
ncbi:hypothetical protein [Serratia ureilytica]|uniref:hypothetical protein n=1 Tax=Serratia ureilytica TaxID=300181 RepID=UPI001C0F5EA1|nr:hypothetical protein [Serratia ureilytica]MBU5414548.1 hypothetical protein [Serratia ureilytica]